MLYWIDGDCMVYVRYAEMSGWCLFDVQQIYLRCIYEKTSKVFYLIQISESKYLQVVANIGVYFLNPSANIIKDERVVVI